MDIQKSERVLVFVDFITRSFSSPDFAKNAVVHNKNIVAMTGLFGKGLTKGIFCFCDEPGRGRDAEKQPHPSRIHVMHDKTAMPEFEQCRERKPDAGPEGGGANGVMGNSFPHINEMPSTTHSTPAVYPPAAPVSPSPTRYCGSPANQTHAVVRGSDCSHRATSRSSAP